MGRGLKALLIAVLAGAMACGVLACSSAQPETATVTASETEPDVSTEPEPAQEDQVNRNDVPMSSFVADYVLPLTEGPWPASIVVHEDEILFITTGEVIHYNNPQNPRTSGEGEEYRSEYEIPVCLPCGKGLALFKVTRGCDWSGADIEFYDPDGRLLNTLEGSGAWPYFCPDGERYINYVMYGDDDTNAYWGGVQLRGIDGTIFFDIQAEQALAIVLDSTGKTHTRGWFVQRNPFQTSVTCDTLWNYFAFAFWGDNPEPEPDSQYLFIYACGGKLVCCLPVENIGEPDFDGGRFDQAVDAQFAELGVVRVN